MYWTVIGAWFYPIPFELGSQARLRTDLYYIAWERR